MTEIVARSSLGSLASAIPASKRQDTGFGSLLPVVVTHGQTPATTGATPRNERPRARLVLRRLNHAADLPLRHRGPQARPA
eukprot:4605829-Prymnesium_polylepis.1